MSMMAPVAMRLGETTLSMCAWGRFGEERTIRPQRLAAALSSLAQSSPYEQTMIL